MKILKSIYIAFTVGVLLFSSCNQTKKENATETGSDYTDTVESSTPLNDNNMRNDQPNEELTKKDSLNKDSI
ncbi:MAG TPA: hypothetical protein VN040_06250 [Pseudosphingobacterium sp.]|nr:hypothetical protein [Pseudosphingobacterium sp.]